MRGPACPFITTHSHTVQSLWNHYLTNSSFWAFRNITVSLTVEFILCLFFSHSKKKIRFFYRLFRLVKWYCHDCFLFHTYIHFKQAFEVEELDLRNLHNSEMSAQQWDWSEICSNKVLVKISTVKAPTHTQAHTEGGCIKLTVTFWHHLSMDKKRSRRTGNNYCWLAHFEPTHTQTHTHIHTDLHTHSQGCENRSQSEQMRLLSWCHLHNDKITILNELSPQNW